MEELYQHALTWYSEFSFTKVDIIDFLFVFWIVFGLVVACTAQIYNRLLRRTPRGTLQPGNGNTNTIPRKHKPIGPVESCQWLNSVINWVYLNYNSTPEYVNAWLSGLNEQAKKQQGSLQIQFNRILAGSPPPRITNINTDPGPKEHFTAYGTVEASELGLQIDVTDNSVPPTQRFSCDVNVQLLKGDINVQAVLQKDDVHVFVRFNGEPEIVLLIKPNPKTEGDPQTRKELESRINMPQLDEAIKQCINYAASHFILNTYQFDRDTQNQLLNHFGRSANHVQANNDHQSMGDRRQYVIDTPVVLAKPSKTTFGDDTSQYPAFLTTKKTSLQENPVTNAHNSVTSSMGAARVEEQMIMAATAVTNLETSPQRKLSSIVMENGAAKIGRKKKFSLDLTDSVLGAPPKPPRTPERHVRQDKRLLVKVVKASGLGAKDLGCNDPYCTVELNEPRQRHTTSVVRNAVNPFWDESFLFDINGQSGELLLEVFDNDRAPGDHFLGVATVSVENLRKQPSSSRHIIPLSGRQPGTGKGGNITVEFLFMDPADAPPLDIELQPDECELMLATAANLSPRRRVETQRTVTPSGVVLTTQTTTLDHGDGDLSDDRSARSRTDSSPNSRRTGSKSKSASMPRDGQKVQIPEIKVIHEMTKSTPTDDHDGRVSTTSSDRSNKPKRSSSLASTLRRRFHRGRKPRSHSADRAGGDEDGHLRPPDQYTSGSRDTEDIDHVNIPGHQSNLKKSKSLGSSLRRLFKGKKKKGGVEGDRSRDSSSTRSPAGGADRLTPEQGTVPGPGPVSAPVSLHDSSSYQQPSPSPKPRRAQRLSASSLV